jgi:hypothetical protein
MPFGKPEISYDFLVLISYKSKLLAVFVSCSLWSMAFVGNENGFEDSRGWHGRQL